MTFFCQPQTRSTQHTVANCRGFSTIEVLAAMVFVAISALATASTMATLTRELTKSSLRSEALALAQEKLEELRVIDYSELTSSSATRRIYTINWHVTENPTLSPSIGSEARLKLITVNVVWSVYGHPQQLSLTTVYTDVHDDS